MAALRRCVWSSTVGLLLAGRAKRDVEIRRHVRALRRTPVRVLYPESEPPDTSRGNPALRQQQVVQTQAAAQWQKKSGGSRAVAQSTSRRGEPERRKQQQSEGQTRVDGPQPAVFFRSGRMYSSNGEPEAQGGSSWEGFRYEKAAPGDKRLAKVVTISKSKKFRDQHGKIVLEGKRLINDALETGAVLQTLFFSTVDSLADFPVEKLKRANLIKVKFEDIKIWSDLVTPQGVIAVFARPDHVKMKYPAEQTESSLPLSLICDNIRDPGNLGTILRCAAGAGCDKVLLTKGCVDVWEPKVLRAGMGAHFRLPIIPNLEWEAIPNYLSGSCRVYVADHHRFDATEREAAASPSKARDYGWVSSQQNPKHNQYEEYESSDDEEERATEYFLPEVDIQCYHEQWAQDQTAVVIGGETHGLSLEALQLAGSTAGLRLYIPMVSGVDSLNSGMAASILLFEAKRQMTVKAQHKKTQIKQ